MSDSFIKKTNAMSTVLLIDPIAVPLTKVVSHFNIITPNLITLLSLLFSIVAAIFFLSTDNTLFAFGGIFYYLAILTDCMDGKLARLTGKTSEYGKKFDLFVDYLRKPLAFPAILFSQFYYPSKLNGLYFGLILVGCHYGFHLVYNKLSISNGGHNNKESYVKGGYENRSVNALGKFLMKNGIFPSLFSKPDEAFLVFMVGPLIGNFVLTFGLALFLFFVFQVLAEAKVFVFGGSSW
jgi:phosphatidylglycerophosphate synthase